MYQPFNLGPEFGPIARFGFKGDVKSQFKLGYQYGLRLNIAPDSKFSFTTGFTAVRVGDYARFKAVPVVLGLRLNDRYRLRTGPVWYLNELPSTMDTAETTLGFSVEFGVDDFILVFQYVPKEIIKSAFGDSVGMAVIGVKMIIDFGPKRPRTNRGATRKR